MTARINRLLQISIHPHHLRRALKWMALDAAILMAAYTIAFFVRAITTPLDYLQSLWLIVGSTLIVSIMLYAFGIYHRIWSMTSGHDVTVIVSAFVSATVFITLIDILLPSRPLPLSVVLLGNALAFGTIVGVRYRSRLITGASWRWRAVWHQQFPSETTKVLIIGAGESGQALALRLKHRFRKTDYAYTVVGFIDDDPDKQYMYIEGCPVLGNREAITRVAERHNIDLIVVAMHNIPGANFREILGYCESTQARIKIVPDMLALMSETQGSTLLRDVQPEDLIGRHPISRHAAIDLNVIVSRRILVTGAAGSIGSELCRQLLVYQAVTLIILDNNESGLHELFIELTTKFPQTSIEPVLADITQREHLAAIFDKYQPQIVFHAAAYKHVPMLESYPGEALRVNVGGTRAVAEIARACGVERFVLISTDKAVNPSSVMGASKRACELLLRAFASQAGSQTLFTSVRFGNVFGSRGSIVPTLNRQIDSGGPLTVTHQEMTRYFMSISEAVNLVIHAACLTKGGDTFLLKMGEVVRILDLAERMVRLRGLRPYVDIEIKFIGIRPGEKLHEQLQADNEYMFDTIHPGIVQLGSRVSTFDADAYLKRLDALLKAGIGSDVSALLELVQHEPPTVNVSNADVPNRDALSIPSLSN